MKNVLLGIVLLLFVPIDGNCNELDFFRKAYTTHLNKVKAAVLAGPVTVAYEDLATSVVFVCVMAKDCTVIDILKPNKQNILELDTSVVEIYDAGRPLLIDFSWSNEGMYAQGLVWNRSMSGVPLVQRFGMLPLSTEALLFSDAVKRPGVEVKTVSRNGQITIDIGTSVSKILTTVGVQNPTAGWRVQKVELVVDSVVKYRHAYSYLSTPLSSHPDGLYWPDSVYHKDGAELSDFRKRDYRAYDDLRLSRFRKEVARFGIAETLERMILSKSLQLHLTNRFMSKPGGGPLREFIVRNGSAVHDRAPLPVSTDAPTTEPIRSR
jgi:hypothetical protein